MDSQRIFQIGISLIPNVGDRVAKTLIAHCGSAEGVFKEKKATLLKIPGIGGTVAKSVSTQDVLSRAEEELKFIETNKIQSLFYLDEDYPQRLKMCNDGPLMLYYKGNVDLNKRQVIAIVGTRNATSYGLEFCENFIEDLKPFNPLVISGLAYGIDICAHKESLKMGVPTVGVLAHGLDRVYPQLHKKVANQMLENGGLLTEFISETNPDRENFPKRNRIVAGISDAVIVVEAAKKGGALITAEIANSYNREVFAVPGNLGAPFSEGCNHLIKINKAAMITGVEDLKYILGWQADEKRIIQPQLFPELEGVEKQIADLLRDRGGKEELDVICLSLKIPVSKALQHLMGLELKGVVKSYPGKVYGL
ncbi:DNA-processing protein DprA [Owenweeksia hongkongensis]|uniref:DNA-processing protein DprA n=1 Tax=Owenweeksia hongkongensis TaxID=253245 RepID=UPI003A948F43